jgi:membrane protein
MSQPDPAPSIPAEPFQWRQLWDVLVYRWNRDLIFTHAAALSYSTLFSLLPLLVLAALILSLAGGSGDSNSMAKSAQDWLLDKLGLGQIQLTVDNVQYSLPQYLSGQIEHIRAVVQSATTGIIGFVALLWGALGLMLAMETSFNHICRINTQRAFPQRLMLYWTTLTLGPVVVAISVYATSQLFKVTEYLPAYEFVAKSISLLIQFSTSWLLMYAAYRIVPSMVLPFRSLMWGALVATVLWELGKYGFTMYLHNTVGVGRWYGNLGLIPMFMFWVYLTWSFVLLGLQVAAVHSRWPKELAEARAAKLAK